MNTSRIDHFSLRQAETTLMNLTSAYAPFVNGGIIQN